MFCLGTVSCLLVIYAAISNRIHSFFPPTLFSVKCVVRTSGNSASFSCSCQKILLSFVVTFSSPFRLLPSLCRSKAVPICLLACRYRSVSHLYICLKDKGFRKVMNNSITISQFESPFTFTFILSSPTHHAQVKIGLSIVRSRIFIFVLRIRVQLSMR